MSDLVPQSRRDRAQTDDMIPTFGQRELRRPVPEAVAGEAPQFRSQTGKEEAGPVSMRDGRGAPATAETGGPANRSPQDPQPYHQRIRRQWRDFLGV